MLITEALTVFAGQGGSECASVGANGRDALKGACYETAAGFFGAVFSDA